MDNFIAKLQNFQFPFFSRFQIYLDLGTSYTRIAIKEKGIVLKEPTIIGLNKRAHEYIFFGQEAKDIVGKVPEFISIQKPIINGIISDFDAEVALTRIFIKRAIIPYMSQYPLLKPTIEAGVAVPFVATEIEQKAIEEVLQKVNVSRVYLIEKPLVTAVGCGFNIFAHKPLFIVDMGGGLIEMSIISGGGIVTQKTLKNGGEYMNKLIYNYIYLKHGIVLGDATCEELKIQLLSFLTEEKSQVVRGKSLENGLPKSVKIKTSDIKEALLTNFNQIIDSIKEMIELSPPEVVDEIFDQSIILTGGLAMIPGISEFFSSELQIKTTVAENTENSTIIGLMKIGRRKEMIERLKMQLP